MEEMGKKSVLVVCAEENELGTELFVWAFHADVEFHRVFSVEEAETALENRGHFNAVVVRCSDEAGKDHALERRRMTDLVDKIVVRKYTSLIFVVSNSPTYRGLVMGMRYPYCKETTPSELPNALRAAL